MDSRLSPQRHLPDSHSRKDLPEPHTYQANPSGSDIPLGLSAHRGSRRPFSFNNLTSFFKLASVNTWAQDFRLTTSSFRISVNRLHTFFVHAVRPSHVFVPDIALATRSSLGNKFLLHFPFPKEELSLVHTLPS